MYNPDEDIQGSINAIKRILPAAQKKLHLEIADKVLREKGIERENLIVYLHDELGLTFGDLAGRETLPKHRQDVFKLYQIGKERKGVKNNESTEETNSHSQGN